jgi:hypothetical protein
MNYYYYPTLKNAFSAVPFKSLRLYCLVIKLQSYLEKTHARQSRGLLQGSV